ncbi:MAG: cbb3-type cytochrome c oxidase N-terminal domain-containing protein [Phycisphaeraceae bacterium]
MSEHEPKQETPTPGLEAPEDELLTGHNYDGIQEYDNPTPAWWTWVFLATVAFTPIYLIFTLMSDGALTPQGQYERAYVANLEKKFGELGTLEPTAETIRKYRDDEQWVAFGRNVFQTHCISCHGPDAAGGSGPNLTDEYYVNVTNIEDIGEVVLNGAGNGAMPAWANRLHPNEVVLVSSYVASLRGTDVPGGKGPEGEQVPAWDGSETPQAPDEGPEQTSD